MSSNNSRNQGSSREEDDTNTDFNQGNTKVLNEDEELDFQDFLVNEFSRDVDEDEDEKIEFDEIEEEMQRLQVQEEPAVALQPLKQKKLKSNCEPQTVNTKDLYDYAWLAEPHVQLPPQNHLYRDIFTSKIGGAPSWLNDQDDYIKYWETKKEGKIDEEYAKDEKFFQAEPLDAKKLTCKHCNDSLFLICQAYVPFGKYERVLYVFGCNRASCSLKQDSYVAYRLQFKVIPKEALDSSIEESEKPVETAEMKLERERKQKEEEQRRLESWNLTKTTDSSNIDDDIEFLLKARQSGSSSKSDKKSSQKQSNTKPTKSNDKNSAQSSQQSKKLENAFPCFSLDTYEDPLTEELDEEDEEWEDEEDAEVEQSTSKDVETKNKLQDPKYSHEKELFDKYKQDLATGELEDFDDFDFDNKNSKGDSSTLALKSKQETIDSGLVKFQLVIDKAPTQSIRWFFRGAPVWISELPKHLPPKYVETKKELDVQCSKISPLEREAFQKQIPNQVFQRIIPKCEHCGSPRVFELEVVPTVVYQLNCAKHVLKKYQKDEDELGLEFGTISIFTCSKQCVPKQKNHYLKEFVFMQPAI